jgi:outer membrane lipoprotein SlyB
MGGGRGSATAAAAGVSAGACAAAEVHRLMILANCVRGEVRCA